MLKHKKNIKLLNKFIDKRFIIRTATGINHNEPILPSDTQVIIGGGGIVGNSIAYNLIKNNYRNVIILEQNSLGSGSTLINSGIVSLLNPLPIRNIIMESISMYNDLHKQGFDIDLKKCGSINLAKTKDRMISLKRRMTYNLPNGLHCERLNKNDITNAYPLLYTDDLEGGIYVPDDITADTYKINKVLTLLSKQGGAQYYENTRIKYVLTKNKQISGIETENGQIINCLYFINCTGIWAREFGFKCKTVENANNLFTVRIPAYPVNHYFCLTSNLNLPTVDANNCETVLPIIRDFDDNTYIKQYKNDLMIGWFEKNAIPSFIDAKVLPRFLNVNHLMNNDEKHIRKQLEMNKNRLPIINNINIENFYNVPSNFTPDGRWIIGEVAEIKNYFIATGMNGNSLEAAGGIGKAIAEWLIEGRPTQELLKFNVQRFLDLHNNRQYLQQRCKEIVARHYNILYPFQSEYKYARKLRCSPLYSVLESRGAVFGIKMAYERALYFDKTYKRGDKLPKMPPGSFYKPKFFDYLLEEYTACRESVGIIDISSFSKIEIKSSIASSVLKYLQKMCSNDVNIPVGGIVQTGMQNESGGYENDCMIVRQTESCFFMVSPSSQQTRIYEWMSKNLPKNDSTVCLNDVTSMYTVLNVVGPKGKQLMSEMSNSDINLSPFQYKKINIGYASDVMVMSLTHTGEPGYCLFIPSEYAIHVYQRLMQVGHDYGAKDVGIFTQRFMRIEKFIPFWGEELTSSITPYEAGNGCYVKLEKEYFIGKYALKKQKDKGICERLVTFVLNDIDPNMDVWPWGGEPIYRNNKYVGTITSSGYGFTMNKIICLGFIRKPIIYEHNLNDYFKQIKDVELKTDEEFIKNMYNKSASDQINDQSIYITNDWILDNNAKYEIDIARRRFLCKPLLQPPILTSENINIIQKKKATEYRPTVVSKHN